MPSRAQQPVPDRDRKKDCEKADYEKGREPRPGLCISANTDHQMGDSIGAARFGAPKSVAVSREDEFSLGVGSAGHRGGFRVPGCKYPNLSIHHGFAVLTCELGGHLARPEEIESPGGKNGD